MNGNEGGSAVGKLYWAPSNLEDADRAPQHAAGRGGSERHDRGGPHDRPLVVEPPPAAVDLVSVRPLVQAPLAPHLVLEMLHRVGDEDLRAGKACLLQGSIENACGRADKGPAGQIVRPR